MLSLVLSITAYTAIVVTLVYIAVYSRMYAWWRHPLGLVMNLSVITVGIVALGTSTRFINYDIGLIIGITGWILYGGLLVWRLRLLTEFAKKQRKQGPSLTSPLDNDEHPQGYQ